MSMIKPFLGTASLLALAAGVLGSQMMMGPGMMRNPARHRYAMMHGTPAPYGNLRNPLPQDRATVDRGAIVYGQNCAACHGADGTGDGPAGRSLSPPPADLAQLARMPMASDAYLYWTIAEGGTPVGSAMPAYKEALSRHDIWSVIVHMRAGLAR